MCVMVDVTAGQVFLWVCWFSFGLENLINEERLRDRVNRESEFDKLLEGDGLTAILVHLKHLLWAAEFVRGRGSPSCWVF